LIKNITRSSLTIKYDVNKILINYVDVINFKKKIHNVIKYLNFKFFFYKLLNIIIKKNITNKLVPPYQQLKYVKIIINIKVNI